MRLLILAAPCSLAACAMTGTGRRPRQVAPILTGEAARDTASYARPEIARVTHVALDLDADFEAQRMAGTATLDIQAAPGRAGDRPRQQGAGDRRRSPTRRGRAAALRARRRATRRAASRSTVRIGAARRIAIRYRSGARRRRRCNG